MPLFSRRYAFAGTCRAGTTNRAEITIDITGGFFMWREFFISIFIFLSCFLFISSCEFLRQDSLQASLVQIDSINKACQADEDCVLVDKGCCGCRAGGESIAVHKSQKNSYNIDLKKKCSARGFMACARWYRCDDFKAQCLNSQCVQSNNNKRQGY